MLKNTTSKPSGSFQKSNLGGRRNQKGGNDLHSFAWRIAFDEVEILDGRFDWNSEIDAVSHRSKNNVSFESSLVFWSLDWTLFIDLGHGVVFIYVQLPHVEPNDGLLYPLFHLFFREVLFKTSI